MCKAVDRGILMGDVNLFEKIGGKSGALTADKSAAA
jgi:molybdenum cofactor biosynthesis enzyme